MEILIGTKNPAKQREIRKYLQLGDNFTIYDLPSDAPDIEETGETFSDNAWIKAVAYYYTYRLPVVTDDGGLEIDALGGQPGVKSRRWPGYEASDQELVAIAMEKLQAVSWENRQASFQLVGMFYNGTNILTSAGATTGYITQDIMDVKQRGFPFRAIFWLPKFDKVYQDLTEEEHDQINHRKVVYTKLAHDIIKLTL